MWMQNLLFGFHGVLVTNSSKLTIEEKNARIHTHATFNSSKNSYMCVCVYMYIYTLYIYIYIYIYLHKSLPRKLG